MNHVMIDIETLGTKPGAVILSLAAVQFDLSGKIGEMWAGNINIQEQLDKGSVIEAGTLLWWERQDKEARDAAYVLSSNTAEQMLNAFAIWYRTLGLEYPWGNSARFDMGLLENLYLRLNMQPPWKHYNERDCRTIEFLAPSIRKAIERTGAHSPIEDCKYQIEYVTKTLKAIGYGN